MIRKPQVKTQVTILVREMREAGMPIKRQQALEMVAKMHGFRDWNTMSGALGAEEQKPVVPVAQHSQFDPSTQIAIVWCIGDVQTVRPDLTDDEAFDLLCKVRNNHDADMGVNWEVLRSTADWDYGSRIVPCTISFKTADGKLKSLPATVNLTDRGIVLVDGKPLSTVNPRKAGTLTFEALPAEEFVVIGGRLAGRPDDFVEVQDDDLDDDAGLDEDEDDTDSEDDSSFGQLVQDIVADLVVAGALTDISQ